MVSGIVCTDICEIKRKMIEPIPDSEKNTIFCAGTIVKGSNIIVVDYYPEFKKQPNWVQIKFAGGKSKDNGVRKDITPEDTFKAELCEEVFAENSKGVILHSPFCSIHFNARNTKPAHTQFFSLIDKYSGVFRRKPLFEGEEFDENGKMTNEKIEAPRWEKVSVLINTMFRGHKPALMALCNCMAPYNIEFAWAYEDIRRQKEQKEF